MPQVLRSHRADRDLDDIVDHIAADNISAAVTWLEGIEALFGLLAAQPELGQKLESRRGKRIRCHSYGRYVIYYQPVAGGVEILRVLHAARDQGRSI